MPLHFTVGIFRFTTGEPSNGDSGRIPCDHIFAASLAELEVETALNDTEEVLRVRIFMSRNTAVKPPNRADHCFLNARRIG